MVTMGATSGAGTAYPSGAFDFTLVFCGVRVTRSLVFSAIFCRSLFVLFLLAIALSVLRFADSDYPFGIFKLFYTESTAKKNIRKKSKNLKLLLIDHL